ncbi:MAG: alginate export family protein [Phycisphaeraceae bacterium]|nr:alginate export family protein [Phycisphaeraceae bacterium]
MKPRICLSLLICLLTVPSLAATDANSLEDAVFGGEFDLNLRVRGEIVDSDGVEDARAFTERLRLGYGSKAYKGFSFYVDFEDIQSFDDDRYNASGLNSNLTKATVADPEATELNQGYLNYYNADQGFNGRFGRQRIILDDARFVGNVGWRQNEQTFDAASFTLSLPFDVKAHYSYLWDINRIFGQSTGTAGTSDYESDSHLFNVSATDEAFGTLTGFAYLLDFESSPANSSDTFGLATTDHLPCQMSIQWRPFFPMPIKKTTAPILRTTMRTTILPNCL